MAVRIKRIYEPVSPDDGYRVLIDRLWSRGIKKENAKIDLWLKEVAPTSSLRKWFNHEPAKWKSFVEKYTSEIENGNALKDLRTIISMHAKVTLLYGAKDEVHNHAAALVKLL